MRYLLLIALLGAAFGANASPTPIIIDAPKPVVNSPTPIIIDTKPPVGK